MKRVVIVIIGIVVVAGIALGVYGFMRALQEEAQPQGEVPSEAVEAFRDELWSRALARGPHPIEGFDAFLLLRAFPGLEEADFDGVQSGALGEEGIYVYANGELTWQRTTNQPVTSAEGTVSSTGYKTLLENLSNRLGMPATNSEEAIAIVDSVDALRDWATATNPDLPFAYRYPEELKLNYIEPVDWPPQVKLLDEEFTCSPAGEETDRAGATEERIINGNQYCITTVAEGAAGSVYRQYAYAIPYGLADSQTIIFTFSLRYPQCGNYGDAERQQCEQEQAAFDLDRIVGLMVQAIGPAQ